MKRQRKDASDATVAAVAKLYHEGAPPPQIAELIGRDPSTIYRALKLAGIMLDPSPHRVEVDGKAIAKLYKSGASVRKAGAACGVSRKVADRRIAGEGVAIRVHEAQVPMAELVERYGVGESQKALARRYSVGEATIRLRLNRAGIARRNVKEAIAAKRQLKKGHERADRGTVSNDEPAAEDRADLQTPPEPTQQAGNDPLTPMDETNKTVWQNAAFESLEFASLAPDRVVRRIVLLQQRIVAQRQSLEAREDKEGTAAGRTHRNNRRDKWTDGALAAVEVAVRAPLALAERVAGLGQDMIDGRDHGRNKPAERAARGTPGDLARPSPDSKQEPGTGTPAAKSPERSTDA